MTDFSCINLQITCNLLIYFFPICGKEESEQSKIFPNISEYVPLKCKSYVSLDETVSKPGWEKII